jgi:hypothetical protein
MTRKRTLSLAKLSIATILVFMFIHCTGPKESKKSPAPTKPAEPVEKPEEVKIYDLSEVDITSIPDITSQNISVEGVKLGERTRDVDKILGAPIKTESLRDAYRAAYRNHGLYVEFNRYTGKVTAIFVNNLYKKAKGELGDLLASGKFELMKKAFGDNPVESHPEPKVTMYEYPSKGIIFIHQDQLGEGGHTLKLVEPKGN